MTGRLQIGDVSITLDDEGCVYVSLTVGARSATMSTERVAQGVAVDYDAEGEMLGVEIIRPRALRDG